MKKKTFKLRVYYEDTDAGGIVYYANYLKFLERARSQILIDNKMNNTFVKNNFNLILIVRSCYIEYLKPAKLDDILEITTCVKLKSRVQIYLDQQIFSNNILLLEASIRLASVNLDGKIVKIPDNLFNIF